MKHAMTRPLRHPLWTLAAALALLSGCGGGGGGGGGNTTDEPISGTYQLEVQAEVGVAGSVRVELQGVSGAPRCTLDSGTIPPGMAFGTDCSLQGTPTQSGDFLSQLTFSIVGRGGSAQVKARVRVGGPVLGLTGSALQAALGQPLAATPVLTVANLPPFTPQAADQPRFAVLAGSLPPGLALDAGTGQLSGTPTGVGTFFATVGGTLQRGAQTFTMASFTDPPYYLGTTTTLQVIVNAPAAVLDYPVTANFLSMPPEPYSGPAPVITPTPPAGSVVSFAAQAPLPPGLALDAATGAISGTPSVPGLYLLDVAATIRPTGGGQYTAPLNGRGQIEVRGVQPGYPNTSDGSMNAAGMPNVTHMLRRGVPTTVAPGAMIGGLSGDRYEFALAPDRLGNEAPAWISLDPVSGVLSATAPGDLPGPDTQFNFGLRVTTYRGGLTITTLMSWILLVR